MKLIRQHLILEGQVEKELLIQLLTEVTRIFSKCLSLYPFVIFNIFLRKRVSILSFLFILPNFLLTTINLN